MDEEKGLIYGISDKKVLSEAEKWPPRLPEVTASKLNVQFFLTDSTWFQVSRRSNKEVMSI